MIVKKLKKKYSHSDSFQECDKRWSNALNPDYPMYSYSKITLIEHSLNDSLRSKRFRLVSKQGKSEERNFRLIFWPREKWN